MSQLVDVMRLGEDEGFGHPFLETKGSLMTLSPHSSVSRRQFLSTTAAGTLAVVGAPAVLTASKTDSKPILGEGDYKYEVIHDWPQLPDRNSPGRQLTAWRSTSRAACMYSTWATRSFSDHPSIFVFDPDGKYIRSFGQEFHGGGHGIEVRQEGSDEFLYVCSYRNIKNLAKLDLQGKDRVEAKRAHAVGRLRAG